MTRAAHAVLPERAKLDADACAAVAAELVAGLDGPSEPGAETSWL